MASLGALSFRVYFEGRKYLIDRTPNTRQELLTQALEKTKLPPGKDYHLQYLETETERIMITDDSDLTVVKSLALSDNKKVVQVAIDRADDKGGLFTRNSMSTGIPHSMSNSQTFDPVKYHEYLKNKIPEISEDFETAMLKGVPCEECLGLKKCKGKKCFNCYGKGYRPVTPMMQLYLKIIDQRIREYIMGPLEIFCSKYKDEEIDAPSPAFDKILMGAPSPKGATTNNIMIEPVPSCDNSILEKKPTLGGLRTVPRRGGDRISEGQIKNRDDALGISNMHPPRKSSSREDLPTDAHGRNSLQM